MSDVAGYAVAAAARLGLQAGDTVGESGYDDDVDHDLRDAIADVIDADLLDDDSDEVLAAVLLWWRDGDGDLTDALINAVPLLAPDGVIWLATPKTGLDGYVEPSEVAEATRQLRLFACLVRASGVAAMRQIEQRLRQTLLDEQEEAELEAAGWVKVAS